MIQKKLLALALGLALFSCQKVSHEVVPEKPQGWEIYSTPKESSLRGLSPVTGDIVWVSGSRGTWMRTLDGGKTWDSGTIAGLDTVDFRSIYGFDAEKAVAVSAGQPAVIYKTLDGGKTWVLKHQASEKAFLDGITFATEERGYVFGDPEDGRWTILETVDQGESWRLIDSLPQAAEGEAGFAASASSLIAEGDHLYLGSGGTEANLYVSKDRGNSWEKFKSPLQQGESSQGIFALTSTGKGEIIVTGGDYLHENQNEGNLGIFLPEDKKITQRDGYVLVEGPPRKPKLGFDSKAGWMAYLMRNNLLFVKRWPTFSKRPYNEMAGLTLSIWYPDGPMCELEPIGPQEILKPGDKASFTEDWWVTEHKFPGNAKSVDLNQLEAKVKKLTNK